MPAALSSPTADSANRQATVIPSGTREAIVKLRVGAKQFRNTTRLGETRELRQDIPL